MKRLKLIILILVLTTFVVACGGQAEPTLAPTAVSIEASDEEPTPNLILT